MSYVGAPGCDWELVCRLQFDSVSPHKTAMRQNETLLSGSRFMRKRTILILDHVEIELMENILLVDESRSGSATIVALSGRMDASSSPAAEVVLSRLIGSGERRIVVDMSDLDYISSAGLRVMLASLKRLREDGGQLLLAGLKPEIRNIFEIAGFQRIFHIYPDTEEAVSSFDAQV